MRMTPLDAVWLMMESAETPMHVGVLAIFRRPRSAAADYLQQLSEQMRDSGEVVAPWNYRLAEHGSSLLGRRMVVEPDVDLDYHFRHSALPAPGGERELGVMISHLHSHPLDAQRPLWEFHFIEGLERDRFAFYLKVHHALIDNVNAVPLLLSFLSDNARSRNSLPFWSLPLDKSAGDSSGGSSGSDSLASWVDPLENLASIGKGAAELLRKGFKRRGPNSFGALLDTPRSTLNRQINGQRRFATQQIQRQRIEALAEASGSTLNEILAYLCGSSLRRFFKEYNALPEQSLIGSLPVSLSERSDRLPGNAIAGIRVMLGTHIGDPLARLDAVKNSMKTVRKDRASLPDAAATSYVMMRAAPTYASQAPLLGRFVPPMFNLGVSNTPGPEKPRYFNGAPLEALYPISQLMQFSALSIDCVSYAGTLNIGFTGARDTLPHLQRLAVYLGNAVDELEQLLLQPAERT